MTPNPKPTHYVIQAELVQQLRAYLGQHSFEQVAGFIVGGTNPQTGQQIVGLMSLPPAPGIPAVAAEKPNGAPPELEPEQPSAN